MSPTPPPSPPTSYATAGGTSFSRWPSPPPHLSTPKPPLSSHPFTQVSLLMSYPGCSSARLPRRVGPVAPLVLRRHQPSPMLSATRVVQPLRGRALAPWCQEVAAVPRSGWMKQPGALVMKGKRPWRRRPARRLLREHPLVMPGGFIADAHHVGLVGGSSGRSAGVGGCQQPSFWGCTQPCPPPPTPQPVADVDAQ
jgi:hypothetical protein